MTGHRFGSFFASDLEAYLSFKQKMGSYGTSRIWYLRQFDAYCVKHRRTAFDRDTVEGWVRSQLARSGRYRSWMSYIRDFGRWLRTRGNPNAYVLSDQWKAQFIPAQPYLLSREEIQRFFTAAAELETPSPWRWQAVGFFTLMHSCGIRTGEARGLLTSQVDLRAGHLDIVNSKGGRSRRLPITGQVSAVLAACHHTTTRQFPGRRTFFVAGTGGQVSPAAVGVAFNRIWDEARLPRPAGGQQPRPYDFRHHFAYSNIERWTVQGRDVTAMLPYLSRYMGHAGFESTFYYVHTSPDFLHAYADLTGRGASVLPEVGFA